MNSRRPSGSRLAAASFVLAALFISPTAQAQDVLEVARIQGVTPPAELVQVVQQDPTRFEFQRAWIQKAEAVRAARLALEAQQGIDLNRPQLEAALAAMTGELKVSVFGALYSAQSTQTHSASAYAAALFGDTDPASNPYTVRTFYREMSLGPFEVGGSVPAWPRLSQPSTYYRPDASTDPTFGRAGDFIKDILDRVDPTYDFGQYDNDGPDGVPNSGDDDGFVDVVAFIYEDVAKSCGGPGIWPHRWVYGGWWKDGSGNSLTYVTNDAAAGGGNIQVWDHMIQAGIDCDYSSIMPIGTFSHELGHALGLPDLYDTNADNGDSEGIGEWGLMGSGNWNTQASPAHMSAWSKNQMGWVSVSSITSSMTGHVMPTVYGAGHVMRYDIPSTQEHFLLEHRSATGSDQNINGPGLLVWHIDQPVIDAGRNTNSVNADETRKGVDLEEADGMGSLDNAQNRGDAGDPYPGSAGATQFTAATFPSSDDNDGGASSFELGNIALTTGTLTFDVTLGTTVATVDTLAVGDSASGVSDGGTKAVYLTLQAGDVVDLATSGSEAFRSAPTLSVYSPADSWLVGSSVERPGIPMEQSAMNILPGFTAPSAGVYRIDVSGGQGGLRYYARGTAVPVWWYRVARASPS